MKLPKEEKDAILESLKGLRSEEVQNAVALEIRRQSNEKCSLPVVDNFECVSDCDGCVFKKSLNPKRGVGGSEGFEEDQLTVRPKGWEPPAWGQGHGSFCDSNVIRNHGWCHRCKEKLTDCTCYKEVSSFDK